MQARLSLQASRAILKPGSVRVIERRVIAVEGTVQGVGFRPYIHSLATARDLRGFVRNDSGGLTIDVQGDAADLDDFLSQLIRNPPPLAVIARVEASVAEVQARSGFRIAPSDHVEIPRRGQSIRRTEVSPDIATCDDCLRELFDPGDRRYRYPFLNCTHCGPRLTIITGLPYDRPRTTMACFDMCNDCRAEYEDPSNRRFHAQPIACRVCGPQPRLVWQSVDQARPATGDPVIDAARILVRGGIVAIKGLGGYHIACDATNSVAVERLRLRKHREAKPLALMLRNAESVSEICELTTDERSLLESRERPIVLLARRHGLHSRLERALEAIAPGNRYIGAMLPYSGLHHLLLESAARPLVMTSGNLADEPIAFDDDDARERLSSIADAFLIHDRPISTRCDDSVMRVTNGGPTFIRRSRGFAPRPITVAIPFPVHVLAVGAHLKNTFCLARDHSAFVSHHIGDLENAAAFRSLAEGIDHYASLAGVRPEVIAHDLHPGYLSTQLAERLPAEARVAVQHHHGHIASCMAEHGLTEPVIGVAFDGAGLGDDGAIWGGEFLLVGRNGYERVGHLGYVPLPGGDAAARNPARMAIAHLWATFEAETTSLPLALLDRTRPDDLQLLMKMLVKKVNSPPTSSIGRLFDAVAALVGLRDVSKFEGQAAMELEGVADSSVRRSYEFGFDERLGKLVIGSASVVRAIVEDIVAGVGAREIAGAFHNAVSGMIVQAANRIRVATGVNSVALSGGVFQNNLLTALSVERLVTAGFDVFTQRLVPCNDGGLSLGQAYVVALAAMEDPCA
jgi:hydrogenase maturation protein HypF